MRLLATISMACALAACGDQADVTSKNDTAAVTDSSVSAQIDTILAAQSPEHQARHQFRNPKQTLEFFGIEPGMTVVEMLPGGGWYSQVLVPLLGDNGTLIGTDYNNDMWPNFSFANEEFLASRKKWPAEWTEKVEEWGKDSGPSAVATTIENIPANYNGSVDAVLYIRALHNLARFEDKGQYLSNALSKTFDVLKPGGVVGFVQHMAPEASDTKWADGSNGYLKKSFIIETMKNQGFEFVAESDINVNAKDEPKEGDFVWRLPPTYFGSKDNPELKAKYEAVGESTRMTLLFKKPV